MSRPWWAEPGVGLLLAAAAPALAVAGLWQFTRGYDREGRMAAAVGVPGRPRTGGGVLARTDALMRATRPGRLLEERLEAADLHWGPTTALAAAACAALAGRLVVSVLLSQLGWLGAVAGLAAFAGYVRRGTLRRREAFLLQVAEVAQVLANLTFAGMALPGALAVAADEVAEPAAGELRRLSRALSVGHPLGEALGMLERRQPSRELTVLVTTLTITSRTGGDMVRALRGTADTLRRRKELREELSTMLASAKANSNAMVVLIVVFVYLMRSIDTQAFTELFSRPLGLLALAVSASLIGTGWVLLRRIVRIEV